MSTTIDRRILFLSFSSLFLRHIRFDAEHIENAYAVAAISVCAFLSFSRITITLIREKESQQECSFFSCVFIFISHFVTVRFWGSHDSFTLTNTCALSINCRMSWNLDHREFGGLGRTDTKNKIKFVKNVYFVIDPIDLTYNLTKFFRSCKMFVAI